MDEPPTDDTELTWWERQMCRNRFTFWAGSYAAYWRYRALFLYDEVMIACWPYDRYPGEWKDLLPGRKNEKER